MYSLRNPLSPCTATHRDNTPTPLHRAPLRPRCTKPFEEDHAEHASRTTRLTTIEYHQGYQRPTAESVERRQTACFADPSHLKQNRCWLLIETLIGASPVSCQGRFAVMLPLPSAKHSLLLLFTSFRANLQARREYTCFRTRLSLIHTY